MGHYKDADQITARRLEAWQRYHALLEPFEAKGTLRRPIIPNGCVHNAHMYYVLLSPEIDRQSVLDAFKREQISAVFQYVPLHSSPAGKRYGRTHGDLRITDRQSERLIRLPLWVGITAEQQERLVHMLRRIIS